MTIKGDYDEYTQWDEITSNQARKKVQRTGNIFGCAVAYLFYFIFCAKLPERYPKELAAVLAKFQLASARIRNQCLI